MEKIKLMAHQVANYPDRDTALKVADALVKGGATYLEIQLPFSDPSADGTAIQAACSVAISKGYTTDDAMDFIKEVAEKYPKVPVFVMTYASLAYTPGIENFVKKAERSHVKGLIVPDLPFDCDEGLREISKAHGIEMVPVAAPSMRSERLERLASSGFKYIYCALRTGITGSETEIGKETVEFIEKTAKGGALTLGGFGIRSGAQAKLLAPHVHAVVAGSVFVNLIKEEDMENKIEAKARELSYF